MKPNDTRHAGSKLVPIKIILPYTIIAFLWAYFSNTIVLSLVHDPQLLHQVLIYKAYFFFTVSSVFLYALFRAATHRLTESEKKCRDLLEILSQKEVRLRQIIDLVPHFIFAKDIEGRFILANQAVADNYGTTVENLIGKTHADFFKIPAEVQHFSQDDLEVIQTQKPKLIPQETITNAQGQTRVLSTIKIPFTASGIDSPCILGVAIDITDYKKSEKALSQSRHFVDSILNATPSLIYVYDLIEKRNIYCNREAECFLGYSPQQIQDMGKGSFISLLHPDDFFKVTEHHRSISQFGDIREIDYRIKDASGQWRWLRSRDVLFACTEAGEPWRILGSAEDITEHKTLKGEVLTLSHYDALTAFPNRTLFSERANLGLSHAKRDNTSCAILFIDLDHFKNINDTLGHSVGDELLRDTAQRLAECVREADTIARLGGDKFIVFLNGLEDAQSVQHIAERIREKFNISRMISGHDLFVTASVGIATFPNDGDTIEDLLKCADTAMSTVKELGRNSFCFFNGTMNEKAVKRMQTERGLRNALKNGEFKLFYQPIISVQDGKVRGFEALLRWFKEDGVMVPPNDFIHIAEETGLIIPIGEWVVQEACRMERNLQDLGFKDIVMSVNISVAQLKRKGFIDIIRNALEEANLSAHSLEIEVTESILIDSFDSSIETLKQIRDMGVKISLDDFGTGYSSLSHLQRLPITSLKIDHLFIKELMNQGVEMAMTAAIIDLAHILNLQVIAEGVEYDLQLKSLARENCDYFQGFLFSKPMPSEESIAYLRKEEYLRVDQ